MATSVHVEVKQQRNTRMSVNKLNPDNS